MEACCGWIPHSDQMTHRSSPPSQPPSFGLSWEVSISSLNTQIPEAENLKPKTLLLVQHLHHPGRRLPESEPHHRVFDLRGPAGKQRAASPQIKATKGPKRYNKKTIWCDRSERQAGPNTFLKYLSLWRSLNKQSRWFRAEHTETGSVSFTGSLRFPIADVLVGLVERHRPQRHKSQLDGEDENSQASHNVHPPLPPSPVETPLAPP